MDLDKGNPGKSTFLGPNGTRYARCHFKAQKRLDFRAHQNFKNPQRWFYLFMLEEPGERTAYQG